MESLRYTELEELDGRTVITILGLAYVHGSVFSKDQISEVYVWCEPSFEPPFRIRGAGDATTLVLDRAFPMPFQMGDKYGETIVVSLKSVDMDLRKAKIGPAKMLFADDGLVAVEIYIEDQIFSITAWGDELYFEENASRYAELLNKTLNM